MKFIKIRSKKVVYRKVLVYNFECSPINGYVANGIVVHNCLYSKIHDSGEFINDRKFYNLIGELERLGVESIEFSGGGESCLHPECFKFAEYIKSFGIRVGLLTNGTVFDWDRVKYFDYIRVGLDAIDVDGYMKVKGGSEMMFNKVVSNVRMLIERKEGGRPVVGLKFIVSRKNKILSEEVVNFGFNLGVDYVHFRRACNDGSDEEDKVELVELDSLKKKYGKFVRGSFKFKRLKEKCFLAPIHAVVNAKGDLLNCCYAFGGEYIIGNVFAGGFKDLWFSVRHKEIINKINVDFCNSVSCRWRVYNNYMKRILRSGKLSFV